MFIIFHDTKLHIFFNKTNFSHPKQQKENPQDCAPCQKEIPHTTIYQLIKSPTPTLVKSIHKNCFLHARQDGKQTADSQFFGKKNNTPGATRHFRDIPLHRHAGTMKTGKTGPTHMAQSRIDVLSPLLGRNLYELPLMRRHLFDRYSIVFHSFSVSQREK